MKLFWLAMRMQWFEVLECFKVLWRFRSSQTFILSYLQLKMIFLLDSPYKVSKRYLTKKREVDLYQYGETPVSLFADIVSEFGVDSSDCVYELGAGSGFCSLWLSAFLDIRTIAVELVPVFCSRLEKVRKRNNIDCLNVSNNSYFSENLQPATLLYIYASNLDDLAITELTAKLMQLPVGTRVISVSYSMVDYCQQNTFRVLKTMTARFPWGEADVFLQVRVADTPMSVD